ncbi:aminotransferase class I/II-fold pyridoxal phosphate-dependent enzyme [Gelidibacter japonicus]|uniref:aminotransferase class I/II-fold pyridoxal phosphate-dependent enzyme n=1 Tax=Gelidibacter japonicus TaxID=1962232 RepID=UPI00202132E8|nr:aminotransferase class I/II-fold pyridoxal phosphate-dependent enzyme [Gelidibacter japonicus]MCL8008020.1 aminotransferase class I/II-fold pyridoxal phosphate-dependent enzyme [Gelidibacter japonicus]
MIVDQFPDRTILVDGETYLYFGGTSYLGMATNPDFQNLLFESIKTWGTSYGSSRNSNIQLRIYQEAEELFSKNSGAEAALTVSSGTLAGRLVLDSLATTHRHFYHYPKTHPAILEHSSQPVFINGALHPGLTDEVNEAVVITADALLSLAVQPTNFDFLDGISSSKTITLLIDESHSLGIVGKDGSGVFKTITHPSISQKIMISSLTKAYGCSGGVIVGNKKLVDSIRSAVVFISAAGMNPIFLQTFVKGQGIIQNQLKKLRENLQFVYGNDDLPQQFYYDHDYPVIYSHSNVIFDYLKSKGIIITNFKYPNYEALMNRIVITANHTKQDLEQLKSALMQFQKETLH